MICIKRPINLPRIEQKSIIPSQTFRKKGDAEWNEWYLVKVFENERVKKRAKNIETCH